jgi:ApaG protein
LRVPASLALPGLTARLDRLVYHRGGSNLPEGMPHAFVYFVTIHNGSNLMVELLGRKWVIEQVDGKQMIIEGDKIVGETPRLNPGESFSYNSYHVTSCDAHVVGGFHGRDEQDRAIHVLLSPFDMEIPESDD